MEQEPPKSAPQEPVPWRKKLWRKLRGDKPWQLFVVVFTGAVSLLVLVLAGYFTVVRDTESVPGSCSPSSTRTESELTSTNDFRRGVWTFSSPRVFPGFSNEDARPTSGVRWLPNCTVVQVQCVRDGGSYSFFNTVDGEPTQQTWTMWARLEEGDWLPLASVAETTGLREPSLGLPRCT